MIAVMKGTKKKDAAIDFIKFVSQPEPQAAFARALMYAPANAKAYALMTPKERRSHPAERPHGRRLSASRQAVLRFLAQQR